MIRRMSEDKLSHIEMPRSLDDPHIVLIWSVDELMPIGVFFIIGFVLSQILIFTVLGMLAVKYYKGYRDGKPDGFLQHTAYWFGMFPGKGYSFINPFIRRWFP